jgi:O-antigen/teichoic acid export membrane protein
MRLARNIIWNTAGIGLPLVVGVAVVPAILRGLGTQRFGFLSIVWMLIGYFGIFDLGLSRTLTKLTADRLAGGREEEVAPLVSTALAVVIVSSAVISAIVAICAGWIARVALASSPGLIPEGASAILFLSASLPFVLLATVFTGLLEAYQEFAAINAVRVPAGVLVLVAPLAVMPFSKHLGVITAALAGLRLLNAAVLALLAFRTVPQLRRRPFTFHRELVRPLVTFGGWLSVSNVVGPLMAYFDRFFIAAVMGSTAVTYYTVPFDVLNRALILPTAIQGVLFPTFVTLRARSSLRIISVFGRSSQTTMLLMLPVLLGTMLLGHEGLRFWVGARFADYSTATAKILVVGVLMNATARIPFVLVQAAGQAKWTALLHLLEFPLYGLTLWSLLSLGAGIEGVAYAWTGRVIVDTAALYVMAVTLESGLKRIVRRDLLWVSSACLIAIGLDWVVQSIAVRVVLVGLLGLACAIALLTYVSGSNQAALLKGSV